METRPHWAEEVDNGSMEIRPHWVEEVDNGSMKTRPHWVEEVDSSSMEIHPHWDEEVDNGSMETRPHWVEEVDSSSMEIRPHWVEEVDNGSMETRPHWVEEVDSSSMETRPHWDETYLLEYRVFSIFVIRLPGFIGRLLMSADAECIRSWVQGSYRAAYLLCSVLDGSDDGCNWRKEKVREAIRPILGELADRSDKAHQTLCKKLEHDSNLPLPEE